MAGARRWGFSRAGRGALMLAVVGVAGIEPATSCSQSKRAPAALHPDGGARARRLATACCRKEGGVGLRRLPALAPVLMIRRCGRGRKGWGVMGGCKAGGLGVS